MNFLFIIVNDYIGVVVNGNNLDIVNGVDFILYNDCFKGNNNTVVGIEKFNFLGVDVEQFDMFVIFYEDDDLLQIDAMGDILDGLGERYYMFLVFRLEV